MARSLPVSCHKYVLRQLRAPVCLHTRAAHRIWPSKWRPEPLQDIYIARAECELELEEELYWALINIYRRPEALFELTKKRDD